MNSTIMARRDARRPSGQSGTVAFSLDPASGVPVYRQIIQQIEYAILSGRMQPGGRLPTIRSLAVELKTNPNTIAKAYGELEIRGILTTQVGSGTYISNKKPLSKNSGESQVRLNRKIQGLVGRFIQEMHGLGIEKKEMVKLIAGFEEGRIENV